MPQYQRPERIPIPTQTMLSTVELVRTISENPTASSDLFAVIDRVVEDAYQLGYDGGRERAHLEHHRNALLGPRSVAEGMSVPVVDDLTGAPLGSAIVRVNDKGQLCLKLDPTNLLILGRQVLVSQEGGPDRIGEVVEGVAQEELMVHIQAEKDGPHA